MVANDCEEAISIRAEIYIEKIIKRYSTFVVKHSWCFLLLGFSICIVLGLSSVILHDLPDFNDPTKGFVPRGKHTLTSRLFVLEKIKAKLDQQLATAKIINQGKESLSKSSPAFTNQINGKYQEDDDDFEDDDSLNQKDLEEDLRANPYGCAFQSLSQNQCLNNLEVYELLNNGTDFLKTSKVIQSQLYKPNEHMCTSIDLNRHYEVYFETSDSLATNLLDIDNLLSLCKKQYELVDLFQLHATCHYTLPEMVAYFSNKSDCRQLTASDIPIFIDRIQRCHSLYDTGLMRFAGLKRYRAAPIDLFQYDTCFRFNFSFLTLEYLLDKTFLSTNETRYTAMWFLKPTKPIISANGSEIHTSNTAHDLFIEHFYQNSKFDDGRTKISALNFMDIRIPSAMKQIRADMFFVILAISLIVGVTVIYLRSITVALMTNICVGLSFACAYFSYKIIFGIDLFPYINLMATFILIGISCDNVFVIFDAWYSEKLDIYNEARLNKRKIEFYGKLTTKQEKQYKRDWDYTASIVSQRLTLKDDVEQHNKDETGEEKHFDSIKNTDLIRMMKVNEQQMIQMMIGVLRHAAASVFVTSFTTSAAFFTNMISRIAYVQLFGLFMGCCILFNFLMTVTMIVSFVIVYEKICEPLSARFGLFNHFPAIFDTIMISLTRVNHAIFTVYIPRIIIKFRYFFITFFLILGILGLLIVFYHPKLTPPKSRRYQFFQLNHPFERFEYQMRDEFLSYINEDKENITNPLLIFIFGVEDIDLVHPFNPDQQKTVDNENIVFNKKIDFYDPLTLRWLDTFLKDLNRSELFTNVQNTYSQWLTIGRLLRGFIKKDLSSNSTYDEDEFFVPSTRNETFVAMNQLFKFFNESNQVASSSDSNRGSDNFRLGFLPDPKTHNLSAFLFLVNMNVIFDRYSVQHDYYQKLEEYFEKCLEKLKLSEGLDGHVYEQVKHGWFVSPQFLFYDLMREVIRGTYTSLIFSMIFAFFVLLLTSGNIVITLYAMITITFIIADTVAIFVLCGWELNILETIIIIMSVGLSVDFTVHYGVAYIKADWQKYHPKPRATSYPLKSHHLTNGNPTEQLLLEQVPQTKKELPKPSVFEQIRAWHRKGNVQRFSRIKNSLIRVGSAVFIAGFTSFLAGLSMSPSKLTSFSQMGFFLMLIMFVSWLFATWFFLPLLSFLGPIDKFADIPFGKLCRCGNPSSKSVVQTLTANDDEQQHLKVKLTDEQSI
ncbi:unnamed protein product [Rotaria magnacalcarata]|uniref:SSD domain-containing protein n=7 Tax=Rotaria magnacalcarata TaxID=392030 RepID=A0A816X1E5_9BILA|nr:unnamed protein product [Rotaria magnacalcarata]CAF2140655.1 unnamed protein product [Rotaria magnacalcarata]CAF3838228.1 unnamed protein product [Rotaria magnacalcarata]CAF3872545.1 unnamed protein product [Rotaria magnacalcarata]